MECRKMEIRDYAATTQTSEQETTTIHRYGLQVTTMKT